MTPVLRSTLTCPNCGTRAVETMPTDACLYFYTCAGCGSRLKPKPGACCIFCSYGSEPCPPVQLAGGSAGCTEDPKNALPRVCSLEPAAFQERMTEIAALLQTLNGTVERTADGIALRFRAGEGLRAALDALAEKERSCCAALTFEVREEAGAISFSINGKADEWAAIEDFAARLAHIAARIPADKIAEEDRG